MTNCAGAIIRQSNRNVNRNIKMSISSKKKKTIYSCDLDKKIKA